MTKPWTRSEPKTLRPFFGATGLEDILEEASIELRRGDEPLTEEKRVLDAAQMQDLDPILRPCLDADGLTEALGPRAGDYELVVTLRTPQMFRRELVGRWRCDGELPQEITFDDPRLLSDARVTGHAIIGITICLSKAVSPEEGWPASPGAWVARKTFDLGIDRRQSTFSFDPLTEEERQARGLPERTAFVVDAEDLNQPIQEDEPMARVLVAPALLDALRAGAMPAAAQAILMGEILDALLDAKAGEIASATEVVEGSGLERLLGWASGDREPMALRQFAEICKSSERRRAFVQHRTDLARNLEALR